MTLGYEVDFLPVGQGERSGDAIALRLGNLFGPREEQLVVVIDGGTKDSGQALVNHIRTYYKTSHVDCVVSTHPDSDHASGLTVIMNELTVSSLWMHRPWEHCHEAKSLLKQGSISGRTIEARFKKSLDDAYELEKLANSKGIPIVEPFSELSFEGNVIRILGPSKSYYESLLPSFRAFGQTKEASLAASVEHFIEVMREAARRVAETLGLETLEDSGTTSAENSSSVILCLSFDNDRLLFTGDAGIEALGLAVDFARERNIDLLQCKFLQVPHHGSKRNVGPSILNRLIGQKNNGVRTGKIAFISCAKESEKHPSKKVVNAFIRRGVRVIATQGGSKWHHHNAPDREGWVAATELPFYEDVEE